ncbi:MAG: bifunctional 4-hydroxy-2-oxoglutarate aldolase/2-dehydro-3-deoxy-phosphogluconate aldolase, partial [Nocardiopsaceae bacterium]|nr:bifunctional 4-hydroxy-2-oxoglutarate aldolase/2-dehydro-3-deoxy-phosphogluconate aldolase [Nocardiopsaceae bacterium]
AADPDLVVGAGTVLTAGQAARVIDAGARFVVTPGFSERIVRECQARGVPVFPGVATATELMAALDAGVETVKFFPAEQLGGLATLRALAAPFGMVKFIPTGGVTAANLGRYLAHPAVPAVGGSWMAGRALLSAGKFDEITRLTAEAVAIAEGALCPSSRPGRRSRAGSTRSPSARSCCASTPATSGSGPRGRSVSGKAAASTTWSARCAAASGCGRPWRPRSRTTTSGSWPRTSSWPGAWIRRSSAGCRTTAWGGRCATA